LFLGRLRREDQEFDPNLGNIERPHLQNKIKQKQRKI
jgi:hypothetical protein